MSSKRKQSKPTKVGEMNALAAPTPSSGPPLDPVNSISSLVLPGLPLAIRPQLLNSPVPVSAASTALWRPGIDETPKMKEPEHKNPFLHEDDEEEDEEDEDEEEEEDAGSNNNFIADTEGGCESPGSGIRKNGPSSKKGSREQTKIQPLRMDSGLEAFRCPLCFPDGPNCAPPANCAPIAGRKALTEHLRWHQNQEPQVEGRFACCYCSKELSSYSSLDRHLLTHTNFRPFVCQQCKRDFTTNGNLNRHVKTSHQGMRPGATMASLTEEIPTSTNSGSAAVTPSSVSPASSGKAARPAPPRAKAESSPNGHSVGATTPVVSAVGVTKPSIDLPSVSPFSSHTNSFGLGQATGLPPSLGPNFVPSCLPLSSAAAAAAAASTLSGTNPAFPSFNTPYSTAQWLNMLMRSYSSNPASMMMAAPLLQPSFLSHGAATGLLPTPMVSGDLPNLPQDAPLTGRPMPVLSPQDAGQIANGEEAKESRSVSSGSPDRAPASPRSARAGTDLRSLLRQRPKRLTCAEQNVTRLRSADSKKLLYKAGLQRWGRVLLLKAVDYLRRKQKQSHELRSKVPHRAISTPIRALDEDFSCPLDLTIKNCDASQAPEATSRGLSRELDQRHTVPSLAALPTANGVNPDDSVLDLSVRSSSLSDGASPPNGNHSALPIGLAGIHDVFVPPLLAGATQAGMPIFHMRQDSPPNHHLSSFFESNNNNCTKAASILGMSDPKKKIDESAKIFTGRYAKRRPQKKTHLAPPTLNPFLKMTPTSQPSFLSDTPVDNQMDIDVITPDTRSDNSSKSGSLNRKKNSYKDAPNRMLCPIQGCEQQFPWKSSLKRHVITHYDFKPYKCVSCGRNFSTKSNRERHIERLHGQRNKRLGRDHQAEPVQTVDVEVPGAAPLDSNDIESMNFSDMKADRMSEEILEKAGTIVTAPNPERLNGSFGGTRPARQGSVNELSGVVPFARLTNGMESGAKNPSCVHCRLEIPGGAQAMQLHLRSVHQSSPTPAPVSAPSSCSSPCEPAGPASVFKCPVCAREFQRQPAALEHMRMGHPTEWTMTANKLNVDSLIQGENSAVWPEGSPSDEEEVDGIAKRILCPVCRRKFASFQDLQRHARSHTGERPFVCSFCGREFALKHSLNRHLRTHVNTGGSGEEL